MTDEIKEIDVLVLGGSGVDTIVYVPQLPLPVADSYTVQPGIETRAGQTGDFVALGMRALGLRVHHLDLIGQDPEGDLVRALHRDRDIALTEVPAPAGTKRAVNLVSPDGRRMSLYDGSRTLPDDRLPPTTVREIGEVSQHAHVSITYPCAFALPILSQTGVTISTDLHDWDGNESYHESFAYAADIVFVSTAALSDPELTMRRIVQRGRAGLVVATAGAEGALLLADGELMRIPAVEASTKVMDSNGAGDAFAAGFLFGWLSGASPAQCGLYGAVAGAHACTVPATGVDAIGREELFARAGAPGADTPFPGPEAGPKTGVA